MVCRRAFEVEWMVAVVAAAVAVAAIMVPENGRMCFALDTEDTKDIVLNRAEQAKETAHHWADQFSGKWVDKQGMQEGVANLINKEEETAADGKKYLSERADDSKPSAKDIAEDFYNEVNKNVEEAYNEVVKSGFSEEARTKYEAMKEKASDAAGEVGAIMRH